MVLSNLSLIFSIFSSAYLHLSKVSLSILFISYSCFCNPWYFFRGTISCSIYSNASHAWANSSWRFIIVRSLHSMMSLANKLVWVPTLWEKICFVWVSLLLEVQASVWVFVSMNITCRSSWIMVGWGDMGSVWVSVVFSSYISF